MAYTSDDRAAALAALEANGNNVAKTADDLGMSRTTLRRWAAENGHEKRPDIEARLPQARATIADRLRTFVDAALGIAPDKLADANLRDTFTAVGIAIDKLQLLEGKPTSIDEVREGDGHRELDEVLDQLAARYTQNGSPPTSTN